MNDMRMGNQTKPTHSQNFLSVKPNYALSILTRWICWNKLAILPIHSRMLFLSIRLIRTHSIAWPHSHPI